MSETMVDESKPRIDFNSPDWHRIVEHLSAERDDLVKQVLGTDVTERRADFYRGRILQISQILEWSPYAGR